MVETVEKVCTKLDTCPYLRSLRSYDWEQFDDGVYLLAEAMKQACSNCSEKETK